MPKTRILIVDDEQGMLEVCADSLGSLNAARIVTKQRSRDAAELLAHERFDLLIVDIQMPELSGIELLKLAREKDPDLLVLVITAFPTVDTAVGSMKLGASDYIAKPFRPDDLLTRVQRLLNEKRLREENRYLSRQVQRVQQSADFIGESPLMSQVFEKIYDVAQTDADVLIRGETGSGKELVARRIHRQSRRCKEKFVPVDCGAIPDALMESEFFGHERGAFTGANARSIGLLEFANGGTVFLDEVAELPLLLQAKLLRALQERTFRRVGDNEETEVDIRVIAATSRNLEDEVRQGRFREELLYRIDILAVEIPPLRERQSDIPVLARHFISQYAATMERDVRDIDEDAKDVLMGYAWPGNVRELQNVIRRAILASRDTEIGVDHLPDDLVIKSKTRSSSQPSGYFQVREQRIRAFEREYLTNLLTSHAGDITAAAAAAQLPRGTLYRLIGTHALAPDDFRSTQS
ncbi:MAG: sigma-54 dependent transcriptional regulator [Verrucomicrobia bacterium]|nr:sigma-54 dependent transcriptional regulator [Verrucomicrobiota bacterium]